jgi:hypothetical protein
VRLRGQWEVEIIFVETGTVVAIGFFLIHFVNCAMHKFQSNDSSITIHENLSLLSYYAGR